MGSDAKVTAVELSVLYLYRVYSLRALHARKTTVLDTVTTLRHAGCIVCSIMSKPSIRLHSTGTPLSHVSPPPSAKKLTLTVLPSKSRPCSAL